MAETAGRATTGRHHECTRTRQSVGEPAGKATGDTPASYTTGPSGVRRASRGRNGGPGACPSGRTGANVTYRRERDIRSNNEDEDLYFATRRGSASL